MKSNRIQNIKEVCAKNAQTTQLFPKWKELARVFKWLFAKWKKPLTKEGK